MNIQQFTEEARVVFAVKELSDIAENRKKQVSDVVDGDGHQYVDLVMEGGGLLGIALLGYTYALEKFGIRFLSLGGTSAGAINTLLLAAAGCPEEIRTAKLLDVLSNQDFREFLDGDRHARRLVDALLDRDGSWANSIELLWNGWQASDETLQNLGLNPGDVFHAWLKSVLRDFGITTMHDLRQRMNRLPQSIAMRNGVKEDVYTGIKETIDLAIIAAELTTQTKVKFPEMSELYYLQPDSASPADFVRASMSIPLFFEPFTLNNLPNGEKIMHRWDWLVSYRGNIPESAVFVDGGILSNFPIDVFHRNSVIPNRPTFGVKLGFDRQRSLEINSVEKLVASCFQSARNLRDFEFIERNADFQQLVAYVDVADHNWLDFSMPDDNKVDLFVRGVEAAVAFIKRFDWHEYKEVRREQANSTGADSVNLLPDRIRKIEVQRDVHIPPSDTVLLQNRMHQRKVDKTVVWIDDQPSTNRVEVEILKGFGMSVIQIDSLGTQVNTVEQPDVIISDIRRETPNAGIDSIAELKTRFGEDVPVFFYIEDLDRDRGTPNGAAGITDSILELIDLVLKSRKC